MIAPQDVARVGHWLDTYFMSAIFLRLSYRKSDTGDIPDEMAVGPAPGKRDDPLLTEWRLLPSRVTEHQVLELERELPACLVDHEAYFALGEDAAIREKVAPLARPLWPSFEELLRELERKAGL